MLCPRSPRRGRASAEPGVASLAGRLSEALGLGMPWPGSVPGGREVLGGSGPEPHPVQ